MRAKITSALQTLIFREFPKRGKLFVSMDLLKTKAQRSHPFHWVVEPLFEEPSYIERAMFGCKGCYLHGRLVLVLAARTRDPWNGLLVPTDKRHHQSLRREHRSLVIHPILKKWLYLPESNEEFEEAARALVESILANNPRIGIEPRIKPRRGGAGKWKRGTT